MFGYIHFKSQEITFALAHLQARQHQITPTGAEMDYCEIWIQTQLKLKTEERLKLPEVQRSFCQPMIASAVLSLKCFIPIVIKTP